MDLFKRINVGTKLEYIGGVETNKTRMKVITIKEIDEDNHKALILDSFGETWIFHKGTINSLFKLSLDQTTKQTIETGTGCNHSGKYLNKMRTFKFWYCPECKTDLGDG